jgi:cytochrome c oxidase subunit II
MRPTGEVGFVEWERARRRLWLACAFVVLASSTGCAASSPSVLHAKGPAERQVTGLWWSMLAVSIVVIVFVVVMGGWGVVKTRRRREEDIRRDVPWGDRFILVSGIGVTGAILVAFFLVSLRSMATLARARPSGVEITITGHDWWWEARYPNGAVTANEIHIPAGVHVRINLRSADVIHSLWVPELAPKIDLIPGRENEMWIQANKPGQYRGQCAEFCGLQHAHMIFFVIADTPADFNTWMQDMAAPAPAPATPIAVQGQQVFLSNTCIGCHAIKGTSANGQLGPDLTHLATRSTIGAGTLPLTPQTLTQWILAPEQIKPGVTMPPTSLTREEVRALVTYLLSLGFQQ